MSTLLVEKNERSATMGTTNVEIGMISDVRKMQKDRHIRVTKSQFLDMFDVQHCAQLILLIDQEYK